MSSRYMSFSVDETRDYGYRLAGLLQANDVVLLSGDLGAGKTEFSQGVARGLGITETVNSPTFNLLLVHTITGTPGGTGSDSPGSAGSGSSGGAGVYPHALYHFDLYRLDSSDQLSDLDYFGMLEDGAVSLVEWGDRFADALPEDYLLVCITVEANQQRVLEFSAAGRRSDELLHEWQALNE